MYLFNMVLCNHHEIFVRAARAGDSALALLNPGCCSASKFSRWKHLSRPERVGVRRLPQPLCRANPSGLRAILRQAQDALFSWGKGLRLGAAARRGAQSSVSRAPGQEQSGQAPRVHPLATLRAGSAVPVPQHGQRQSAARIAQVGSDLGQRTQHPGLQQVGPRQGQRGVVQNAVAKQHQVGI